MSSRTTKPRACALGLATVKTGGRGEGGGGGGGGSENGGST